MSNNPTSLLTQLEKEEEQQQQKKKKKKPSRRKEILKIRAEINEKEMKYQR